MPSTTDQIEQLARDIVILKINEDLQSCRTLEDFEEIRKKYEELAKEIPVR